MFFFNVSSKAFQCIKRIQISELFYEARKPLLPKQDKNSTKIMIRYIPRLKNEVNILV